MKTLPNYCRSFREEAHRVWSDMSEAEGFALPRNEETTTEHLLLRLARKHHGRGLNIRAYTKPEESANGADWAFWFSDRSRRGIGTRVQAKRLFADKGCYKSLYHQSDKQKEESRSTGQPTPNQCERLLSHRDGLIPIYAFYNSDALDLRPMVHELHRLAWWVDYGHPFHLPDWGISVASATAIRNADWGAKNRPGDFRMIPWHCLVCPCCWDDRPVDQSLPFLVANGLRHLYGETEEEIETKSRAFDFEPTNNPPTWVGLLHADSSAEEQLSAIMAELNLKGVAIIEETEARDE